MIGSNRGCRRLVTGCRLLVTDQQPATVGGGHFFPALIDPVKIGQVIEAAFLADPRNFLRRIFYEGIGFMKAEPVNEIRETLPGAFLKIMTESRIVLFQNSCGRRYFDTLGII